MKPSFSIAALALVAAFSSSTTRAAAADVPADERVQHARTLEAAGRFGDAWEAADLALATEQGSGRVPFEELKQRLAERSGFLSLRVEPSGSEVFVDGVSIGMAPVAALRRVNVGVHEIRVTKAGFDSFVQAVSVAPDGKAIVSVGLVRESVFGMLRVNDEGGQPLHVVIDGVDVGPTPLFREVSPGKHRVSGAGVDRVADEKEVDVPRGKTLDVALTSRPIAATVMLHTKDRKGVVRVDGAVVGEGSYAGTVRLGVHRLEVTLDGHQPWRREVVLQDGETFDEEVVLEEPPHLAVLDEGFVPPKSGWYGGFGLLGSIAPAGTGSEMQIACADLGAASCSVTRPLGGGLSAHVGYDFDPIGFELRAAGGADYWTATGVFDGNVAAARGLASAAPARTENFNFVRAGGTASLQVRASWKPGVFLMSAAVGAGASYRSGAMSRKASVDDPALASLYSAPSVPPLKHYLSPALTGDVSIGFKIGSASWLTLGVFGIIETAGNNFRSEPGESLTNDLAGGQGVKLPALPSAAYHYASGTQYIVGPEIAFRFGP